MVSSKGKRVAAVNKKRAEFYLSLLSQHEKIVAASHHIHQRKSLCPIAHTLPYKTQLGNIAIELYPAKAPVTVANFMQYVNRHLYDSSSFFRACTPANEADRKVKIQVIQGGNVKEGKELDSIAIETTRQTGLLHKNGTLSMARSGPNSATSQFFICVNDQPALDYAGARNPDGQGFAAFGQVTSGMDIVKKIQAQNCKGQYLIKPVIIYSIKEVK